LQNHHKKDALENYLGQSDKNIIVENVTSSDLANREQQLKLDYDVIVSNKVSSFDDELYIDLELLKEFDGMDFKDRKTDYEFDYKTNYVSTVALQIPAGYKISKFPENFTVTNNDYQISITYTQTAKELICKKIFLFNKGVVKASEFNAWNDINKNLKATYNQPIVFTKS
jgi:hypothetical protein